MSRIKEHEPIDIIIIRIKGNYEECTDKKLNQYIQSILAGDIDRCTGNPKRHKKR